MDGERLSPAAKSPENGSDARCAGDWLGPRVGVDGCGEEKSILPTPVFSWDTAVTESNSLLQILVLDLNLIGLAGNENVLVNKTSRRTEYRFYWYYDSTCFGQPFCPSSGVLSRTSALVHFMQI